MIDYTFLENNKKDLIDIYKKVGNKQVNEVKSEFRRTNARPS